MPPRTLHAPVEQFLHRRKTSEAHPLMMPVETLVHHNRALHYRALQDPHLGAMDYRPFIGFMLGAIGNSPYKYIVWRRSTPTRSPMRRTRCSSR